MVHHFHLLVTPRYEGDGVVLPARGEQQTEDTLEPVAAALRVALNR